MEVSLGHESNHASLLQRCIILSSAAEEIRKSASLKKVLSMVLKIMNFINHGSKDLRAEGSAKGFSIESLHTLASFKMGSVSTLHFLCISMRSADIMFYDVLKSELKHVHSAAREKTPTLKSGVEAFSKDLVFARREQDVLKQSEEFEASFAKNTPTYRVSTLCSALKRESEELAKALEKAFTVGADVQRYFGAAEKSGKASPPLEQFFGHFASFLDSFEVVWLEIDRKPAMWQKFLNASEKESGAAAALSKELRRKTAGDQNECVLTAFDGGSKPSGTADAEDTDAFVES
jgi:hypothetical protein